MILRSISLSIARRCRLTTATARGPTATRSHFTSLQYHGTATRAANPHRHCFHSTHRRNRILRIGHVERDVGNTEALENIRPSCIPLFQWMLSKDNLHQDMLLVGPPGSGSLFRRRLALQYAQLVGRSVEILTLTRDTTESDLKQRRELIEGGRIEFVDQAPVRAARNGSILILDGLEKAERNVLPTLNNLLENREMPLEDGRLLVPAQRYERLLEQNDGEASVVSHLIPAHEDFRVIALGVPVPPYPGRGALDPPLRSRFQIRRLDHRHEEDLYPELLKQQQEGSDVDVARALSTWCQALEDQATDSTLLSQSAHSEQRSRPIPFLWASSVARLMEQFPQESIHFLLRIYPFADERLNLKEENSSRAFWDLTRRFFPMHQDEQADEISLLAPVATEEDGQTDTALVRFPHASSPGLFSSSQEPTCLSVIRGPNPFKTLPGFVSTAGTNQVLRAMMQEHWAGSDMLLISPKGEGKSTLAHAFASQLGYSTTLWSMYPELTSRDLLLRRTSHGTSTGWEDSPLVQAARQGHVLILDGVEKLPQDALTSLHSLVRDREIVLPDGRKLVQQTTKDTTEDGGIVAVHPSFRIIALGTPSEQGSGRLYWLNDEVVNMFKTIVVPSPTDECLKAILQQSSGFASDPKTLSRLMSLHKRLVDAETARDCGIAPLSTRNLIRIVKGAAVAGDLHSAVCSVVVATLLPPTQRAALETVLQEAGIRKQPRTLKTSNSIEVREDSVVIGDFQMRRFSNSRPELVPAPTFFDIPSHVSAIGGLLREWDMGERAFLLLGNQGVGKNKIVDRICEVVNFEREYIQLHRDSTIGQLTLTPSLEEGKIIWKDSPLVRAVRDGRAMVIDEADKAPVEVVAVLKGLVEDGELMLADGRRISRNESGEGIIPIHKDFTLWVLANRPGFPFHGNDFFREVGDCFSTVVVANPDLDSEVALLRSYAPTVNQKVLRSIAASFADLRKISDHGEISYPYSTREAVSVIKHLEKYPDDDVVSVLHNVLDMDSFDARLYSQIGKVFQRHGINMTNYSKWQETVRRAQRAASGEDGGLTIEYLDDRTSEGTSSKPPPLGAPKRGKWDDKNEAHVGGNQWAGGTGGSDTAGLGGRGGPYRLDRGHKVHQVSDEAKAEVSAEAAAAAKEIRDKAMAERLAEIGMSKTEWELYGRFLEPIRKDIANLRGTLANVEAKRSERGWLTRQSHGELDDSRLVDGITGEKYVYKRRGIVPPESGKPMQYPKRLRFVMDVSGSMYRFNGYDERLQRCLEATALIMESFSGLEGRFDYSIVGHSGDSAAIRLVEFGKPPENENERMQILQTMVAHAQFCASGDNTLEAMERAVVDVVESRKTDSEIDEYIVVGVSDANLARYGIHPRELAKSMIDPHQKVKSYCVMIASFGEEADEIKQSLPPGRGFVCMQTADLPRIVRDILSSHLQ